jgi:hypothetical protein
MSDMHAFFTQQENSILIKLILAHLLSDFVFQTRSMAENKNFRSAAMGWHIGITFLAIILLVQSWKMALSISAIHYAIDSLKVALQKKYPGKILLLFLLDQFAHVISLLTVWAISAGKMKEVMESVPALFNHDKFLIILAAYLVCTGPASYIVKLATQNLIQEKTGEEQKIRNGGKWIGQLERVIILTFVLLSEYQAIGLLIAGKSIIRFADKEHLRTEYVLVGTLLSFAIAIGTGVATSYLLGKFF